MSYNIAIASDHSGYLLKAKVVSVLEKMGHKVEDLGTNNDEKVDYPDYANNLCNSICAEENQMGILICSTGIGMSIVANRHSGIRAALVTNKYMVEKSRMHNDANVLVLGSKILEDKANLAIVEIFLKTSFEGGRHSKRLAKIN